MMRKVFIVLLPSFGTLGEARESFLSFPNIEKTGTLLLMEPEATVVVGSTYRGARPNSSYLLVQSEDPKVLRALGVTRASWDATHFVIKLATEAAGETDLTLQLWDSEGRRERLVEGIKGVRVKALSRRPGGPLRASPHLDRNALMLPPPLLLFSKCAFGCKIELPVFRAAWRRPLPVIPGALAQFFLMPFCGFLLTQVLALPEAQAFGFVMTCTCPGAGGGYLFALLLEGDVTLAILMTCTSTALALVLMPVRSSLYSRVLGLPGTFRVPVLTITSTLLFMLVPISAGIVLKRRLPEKAAVLERVVRPLSLVVISAGFYLMFGMGLVLLRAASLEALALGVSVPALGLLFGYSFASISRLPLPVRKTIAVECGQLNSFLALAAIPLSLLQSEADSASVAPFAVARGAR